MKWLGLILVLLLVSSVVATGDRVIYYPLSSTGGGNITYNITYFGGEMNQTPNMTAGLPGAPGANGLDGIMNQTANMTAGAQGIPGVPGTTDMSWNASYYLRDTSLSLTGTNIFRNVDNSYVIISGGGIAEGKGGAISFRGADGGGASVELVVPNAAKNGYITLFTGTGVTNDPHLRFQLRNLTDLGEPVVSTDAATKNYVDNFPAINGSYYLRDGSRPITDYDVFRDTADEILILHGGTNVVGQGAMLKLYGHGYAGDPGGDIQFTVPNTAGDGDWLVARIKGNTELPYLDLFGNQIKRVADPTVAQDAATMHYVDDRVATVSPAGSLRAADWHILSNLTTADQHIATNATADRLFADQHIATNYTAVLRSSDDHISTNMSTVSAPASLLAADQHILSNLTTADQHIASNMSGVSAPGSLLAADLHILSNLTTSDQHIATNYSAGIRIADNHILSNLTVADEHIATNYSAVLRKADDHILTNVSASSGNGYTLTVLSLAIATTTDFTPFFFGGQAKIPGTVGLQKMYFPKTGTIKAIEIFGYSSTAGTAEGWDLSIVNATSTTNSSLIAMVATSATTRRWSNTSMLKPATAGDYIEIRSNSPGWVTNPLALVFSGSIYIE